MLAECANRKWLQDRSVRRNPAGSGGQMALFGKKANFRALQKLEWNQQMLGHIVCFRPAHWNG
jgi:hypothetical protein